MNCNKHPVVTIKKMVNGGYGLGRLPDGKKLFVRHCLPGETVKIRLNQQKKRFGFADTVEVLKPSPQRITAPCPYYGRCGGCNLQHSTYEYQCLIKTRIVSDLLAGSGSTALQDAAALTAPTVGSPLQYHYRQRIRLQADRHGAFGFSHFRSHDIVAVDCCLLAREPLNHCFELVRQTSEFKALASVCIELELLLNPLDDMVSLLFKLNRPPRPADRKNAQRLGEGAHQVDRVFLVGHQFALEGPFGHSSRQEDRLLGFQLGGTQPLVLCWEIGGFSQVNIGQNYNMIDLVLRSADGSGSEQVLDLYCGMGNFSLPLARQSAAVYGIENQGSAIRSAQSNSRRNGLDNCSFEQNDVAAGAQALIDQRKTFDTLIIDPPRRGIAGLAPLISRLARKKVIYISCDPATLCRDLADLAQNGFTIKSIQPLDMFPQTHHIETVVALEKHGPSGRNY